MTDDNRDERDRGVDFEGLEDELASYDYPTTVGDLVDDYGDHELKHSNGSVTLRELLEPASADQELESEDEARTTILNFVGSDAVGAEGYSDRGTDADNDDTGAV